MTTKPKIVAPPSAVEGPDAKGRVWHITGKKPSGKLLRFERGMKAFMAQNDFVGGTLAILKDDRLVFARAYSHAKGVFEPIKVESLFRIASCSKPVTCVGIYQLVESKAFKLTDKVQDILALEPPPDGPVIQQNATPQNPFTIGHYFHKVEVRHLLNHLGGWNPGTDGSVGEATFFRDVDIAKAHKHKLPVKDTEEVARWGVTQPMDFVPGFVPPGGNPYSNFGYLLLGLVIAKVTGMTYEDAIKSRVFDPIGTPRPLLSKALKKDRAKGEVAYHVIPPVSVPSLMHDDGRNVPLQYGGENNGNFAGFGGWALAAVDYARFLAELHRKDNKLLATPAEDLPVWTRRGPVPGIPNVTVYGHGAGIPGSQGDVDCRSDGVTIVAFFNSWSSAENATNEFSFDGQTFPDHLPMWHAIANEIGQDEWPDEDQFPKYFKKPKKALQMPPRERIPRLVTPVFPFPFPEFERRSGRKALS